MSSSSATIITIITLSFITGHCTCPITCDGDFFKVGELVKRVHHLTTETESAEILN